MTEIFEFFGDMFARIVGLLDTVDFDVYGIDVSVFDLMLGLVVLFIIINVFWKGAKS